MDDVADKWMDTMSALDDDDPYSGFDEHEGLFDSLDTSDLKSALVSAVGKIGSPHSYPTAVRFKEVGSLYGVTADYDPSSQTVSLTPGVDSGQIAHELGHHLDRGLGRGKGYASMTERTGPVCNVMATIEQSNAYGILKNGPLSGGFDHWGSPHELFARAYERYVVQKSDADLVARPVYYQDAVALGINWTDADFEPIRLAIDGLLTERGLN